MGVGLRAENTHSVVHVSGKHEAQGTG